MRITVTSRSKLPSNRAVLGDEVKRHTPRTGLSALDTLRADLWSILSFEPPCSASDEQHDLWEKIDQTHLLVLQTLSSCVPLGTLALLPNEAS